MADIYEKAILHQLLSNFSNSKNESFGKFIFKCFCLSSTRYILSPDRDSSPATEALASAVAQYQITGDSEKLNSVVSVYISGLQNFSTERHCIMLVETATAGQMRI